MDGDRSIEIIKEYYGRVLQTNQDLQTSACCTAESLPAHLRAIEAELHDEVRDKFYGCGSPIPLALEGATVLDLGCGSGRDTFILSKRVGERGQVIGVDMTDEQLAVAERHREYHARKFGFTTSNVRLVKGYIEDLAGAGVASGSVDVVISNCVLNLSPDKRRVFAEIFRVLKPGGELFFSDVFAGRRIPAHLAEDPLLLGECLGGALYTEDFRRILRDVGCLDYRVVTSRPIALSNPEIERRAGMIPFFSKTVRAFKLELEDLCEDYGQVAYYQGTLPESPHQFVLDDHHVFKTGQPMLVCGNTAAMVQKTRYARHFRVVGDRSVHYGPFDCAPVPAGAAGAAPTGACC
ncbi:MAG: methyltransferase domain-containing protein [Polyangia bacterium]